MNGRVRHGGTPGVPPAVVAPTQGKDTHGPTAVREIPCAAAAARRPRGAHLMKTVPSLIRARLEGARHRDVPFPQAPRMPGYMSRASTDGLRRGLLPAAGGHRKPPPRARIRGGEEVETLQECGLRGVPHPARLRAGDRTTSSSRGRPR